MGRSTKDGEDSRRSGRQLAESFLAGAEPQAIQAGFYMRPDEQCFGLLPVTLHQEVAA